MNVKSMIVGFLIAVVASTGTYLLAPPPRDADAAFSGLSVKEIYQILESCHASRAGSIKCWRHQFGWPLGKAWILHACSQQKKEVEYWGVTMSREECLKHYEPHVRR